MSTTDGDGDVETDAKASTNANANPKADGEGRDLAEYDCVHAVEILPDPTHGEVHHAVFDPDIVEMVFRDLLDAIRHDGYELVAFGTLSPERRDRLQLDGRFTSATTATFVYRG